jgi:hypothetical protein
VSLDGRFVDDRLCENLGHACDGRVCWDQSRGDSTCSEPFVQTSGDSMDREAAELMKGSAKSKLEIGR